MRNHLFLAILRDDHQFRVERGAVLQASRSTVNSYRGESLEMVVSSSSKAQAREIAWAIAKEHFGLAAHKIILVG